MKTALLCVTLLMVTFGFGQLAFAQNPTYYPNTPEQYRPLRPAPPKDFQKGQPAIAGHPQARLNAAQRNARALVTLANQISAEVDQLSADVLNKNLPKQLKQMQKLAKRLRSQIMPSEDLRVPAFTQVDRH